MLPAPVLDLIASPSEGFDRSREDFPNRMGTRFDALAAAQSAASHFTSLLLNPERLNRMAWQHARDARLPGVTQAVGLLLQRTWQAESAGGISQATQSAANGVVLDGLLSVLDSGKLHAAAQAEVRQLAADLARWLAKHPLSGADGATRTQAADLITRYLANPQSVKLRGLPSVPPGEPI
jgi:hypothetical protein